MKIRAWSIDGFGLFRDAVVADLPDGLTVFHGVNEAGKTTLLEFLRAMLFGPPAAAGASAYPPLHGGRHGGRLVLAGPDGDYVVARALDRPVAPAVTRPDGAPGDAADLSRLLGGADAGLFRAVFSVGLDDLQSLAGLDAAGLREQLFSASIAGAARSARAAAQTLRRQTEPLLNAEGPARIPALIAELNDLRGRLAAARHTASTYGERAAAAAAAAAAVDAARAGLAALRAARAHASGLLQAWPAWRALAEARAELAALAPVDAPPADAESGLRAAQDGLGAARAALAALRAEQADAERQLAALPDAPAPAAAAVESLCADLTLHRFQLATLPSARARAAEAEALLDERLRRLGPDWSAERLREWGRAAVDRDSVRDWQARLQGAALELQQAQWRLEGIAGRAAAARRAAELAAAALDTAAADAGSVAQRQQDLAALRAACEQVAAHRARGEATAHTLLERERALRALEAEPDGQAPAWVGALLAGLAAAVAACAAWAGTRGGWLLPAVLALGAGAAAAGALRVQHLQRLGAARDLQRQAARRTLRSELETARRTRDAEWHRAAQIAEAHAESAVALGLPRHPGLDALDECARGLAEAAAQAAHGATERARLAELVAEQRAAEGEAAARQAAVDAALAERAALEQAWQAWAASAGFEPPCAPAALLERVGLLEAGLAALAAVDAAARERRQVEPLVAAWETRARAALGASGDAEGMGLAGEALAERVVALRARLLETAPQRAQRAALGAEMRERGVRLAAAEAAVERAAAEVAAVLDAAGVRDEAELGERRAAAARRAELERAVAERARALAEQADGADAGAALAAGEPEQWRRQVADADAAEAALEQRLYQAVVEHERAQEQCRALEESSEVPALEQQWAGLMDELGGAVHDWRVLAAAEGLVDEARHEFERSRQPAVLRAASQTFAAVTGGRYPRIVQDEGGQALLVVDAEGRARQVGSELSRGTADQLYLSLRLGLAEELGRRGAALPLVLDDVLVNFDPERARAMAAVLGGVARRQQVLFFTCHAAARDLLIAQGDVARVVEL